MMKNRNMRRMLSILLILAMLLPIVSMTAFSQDLPCAEDGCSGKYLGGICSAAGHYEAAPIEEGVYKISNAGQLYWFAALVNSGDDDCDAALTADITINADMAAEGKLQWTPIGLYTSAREYVAYSGTFDGAGHTIYGLYYDNTAYHGRNAGLFGTLAEGGTVKDLTLADSVINGATEIGGIVSCNYGTVSSCTQSGVVTGTGATGGIVCRNLGVVENCVNTGIISGATTGGIAAENSGEIVACENSGVISGTSSVGGIVGRNEGTIADSLNTADVTASVTHVGGVAGNHLGGEIARCGNTGDVNGASDYIGGVAGVCLGANITESYNTGDVIGNSGKSEAVGGIVGAIDGTNTDNSVITSVYNTGSVTGRSWVGGITGISGYQKTPMTVELGNGYNTGAVSGSAHTGAVVGKLSKGTVSGFYYLSGAQNTVNGAEEATAAEFASGEITASLNEVSNVWYQALDLEGIVPDASPVLDENHGVIYYGYANCTELGYTNRENYNEPGNHVDADGDNVCDKCGHVEGEVHEHVFGDEWTVTKEPTCSEPGLEERSCTECGWTQKREIPTAAHTEEIIPGVSATFDETGLTDGVKCSVCGEILVHQETAPVLDYNEGIIPLDVLNVSCGDYEPDGGASEGPANLAMDNDLNTIWHTDWYGTSRDNHWIQFEITEDYQVDGLRYKPRITGNTNGIITQYDIQVSNDGETFRSVASGTWEDNRNWKVVEFDAETVKYVRLVAVDAVTDNNYVFASAAEIRLTGVQGGEAPHEHSWSDWTVTTPATCTEAGVETRTCECGESETRAVAALGHTEEILPAVEATCTEDGLTEGVKCSVCGEILVAQEVIPALGHDWSGTGCNRCDETRNNPFTDVPENEFYFEPVLWAVEKGITQGATATTFNPNGDLLRAQFVTMLWRDAGCPKATDTTNPFTDVKETDFFYDAVLWAVEEKITTGISPTEFGSYMVTNRAQAVTFLWRYLDEPTATTENSFTDVVDGAWYEAPINWAVEKGVTNGINATEFGINTNCNRAHAVTFMYRALAE